MMRLIISFFIAMLMLTGCAPSNSNHSVYSLTTTTVISNPTAQDILKDHPYADIFQYDDIIYENASNIDWVQQKELTIGEPIGSITGQYEADLAFEDGMATVLPIGTEIFEPAEKSGPILIVVVNGEEVRYLGLIEG